MRMPAEKITLAGRPNFTVLGPCPGCTIWTLEYDDEVAFTYVGWRMVDGRPTPDIAPFHQVIEDALAEHLHDCYGLRELLE